MNMPLNIQKRQGCPKYNMTELSATQADEREINPVDVYISAY